MIKIIFFGILFGAGANAFAGEARFIIGAPSYESSQNAVRYELKSTNCKSAPSIGEATFECINNMVEVTIPVSCEPGTTPFRDSKVLALANDSLRDAKIKCGGDNIMLNTSDAGVPASVGVSLKAIEDAIATRDKSKESRSTLKVKSGPEIGTPGKSN